MKGKKLSMFIDALYNNPEMEIEYMGTKYMISGYIDSENYTLCVDTIEKESKNVFLIKSVMRQTCVEAFENAKIFFGKTIYEAEQEIVVLYG